MICRLTPKSCKCTLALRLAKTVVFCCPDQLNKSLTDKIESVRLLLPLYARSKPFVVNVRANSTFVVATSQSQRVALSRGSAVVIYAANTNGGMAEWGARSQVDCYVAGSARIVRKLSAKSTIIELIECWSCSSICVFGLCPRSALLRFRLSFSPLTTRHIIV